MPVSVDLTNTIISQAWTKAEQSAADLQDRLDAAQTAVSGSSGMGAATAAPIAGIAAPVVNIPLEAAGPDLIIFDEYNTAIFNKMVAAMADYIANYFPMDNATLAAAEGWLQNAIAGGTGVNPAIESQLFERDRSRILAEGIRAVDDLSSVWSARRFPLPPGPLAAQVMQVQQKTQDELAKSSRETAIKMYDLEIENVRFAVENAIKLRGIAVSAAGDYIKALASSQNTAYELSMGQANAQNGLISAAAAFYNAKTNAEDTMFKSRSVNAGFNQEAAKVNATISAQDRHKRGDIAVAAADAVARQVSAYANNLHTSVGVSGSEKIA